MITYNDKSLDKASLDDFLFQIEEQMWYVFNAQRVKNTPIDDRDEVLTLERIRVEQIEKEYQINSDDGYSDMDIGYLFGLYAVLKYFAVRSLDWEEIDQEINYLVDKYRRNSWQ